MIHALGVMPLMVSADRQITSSQHSLPSSLHEVREAAGQGSGRSVALGQKGERSKSPTTIVNVCDLGQPLLCLCAPQFSYVCDRTRSLSLSSPGNLDVLRASRSPGGFKIGHGLHDLLAWQQLLHFPAMILFCPAGNSAPCTWAE